MEAAGCPRILFTLLYFFYVSNKRSRLNQPTEKTIWSILIFSTYHNKQLDQLPLTIHSVFNFSIFTQTIGGRGKTHFFLILDYILVIFRFHNFIFGTPCLSVNIPIYCIVSSLHSLFQRVSGIFYRLCNKNRSKVFYWTITKFTFSAVVWIF